MGLDNVDYAASVLDSGRRQYLNNIMTQQQHQQQDELSRDTLARLALAAHGYVDGLYGTPSVAQLNGDRDRDLDRAGLSSTAIQQGSSSGYPNARVRTSTPRVSSPVIMSAKPLSSSTTTRTGKSTAHRQQQRARSRSPSRSPSLSVSQEEMRKMLRMMNAGWGAGYRQTISIRGSIYRQAYSLHVDKE